MSHPNLKRGELLLFCKTLIQKPIIQLHPVLLVVDISLTLINVSKLYKRKLGKKLTSDNFHLMEFIKKNIPKSFKYKFSSFKKLY